MLISFFRPSYSSIVWQSRRHNKSKTRGSLQKFDRPVSTKPAIFSLSLPFRFAYNGYEEVKRMEENTIIQAVLHALEQHSDKISSKMEEMEQRLRGEMHEMGQQLRSEIHAVETRLEAKIDSLREEMQQMNRQLNERSDRLEEELADTQTSVDVLTTKVLHHDRKLRQLAKQA
ncbi:hypothetical protein B4113_1458 [Geobacillus sp. B4113_201601]|nr:hypothetical protein B4113_1458 [Geobacillus sp. B4113_201601]